MFKRKKLALVGLPTSTQPHSAVIKGSPVSVHHVNSFVRYNNENLSWIHHHDMDDYAFGVDTLLIKSWKVRSRLLIWFSCKTNEHQLPHFQPREPRFKRKKRKKRYFSFVEAGYNPDSSRDTKSDVRESCTLRTEQFHSATSHLLLRLHSRRHAEVLKKKETSTLLLLHEFLNVAPIPACQNYSWDTLHGCLALIIKAGICCYNQAVSWGWCSSFSLLW